MDRRRRAVRVLVYASWLGVLGLALRIGGTAFDTNPEHLVGLLGLAYLAAWGPYFVFSPHGPAGTLGRFALCTGALGLALGAMEVPAMLRLVDYRVVFTAPTPPWQRAGNGPDPDLIYVRRPHQKTRFRYDGAELYGLRGAKPWRRYNCELVTDAHGFRNPTDAARADVVVIGDSFIEGLHVEADALVTSQLAEMLGRSVVNLGRTGYGPQQEANVLRRYGVALKPSACVWAFYEGNDLQDLHEFDANRKNLRYILDERRSDGVYGRSFVRNGLGFAIRNWLRPDATRPAAAYTGLFTDRDGREVPMVFGTGIQHGAGGPEFPRGTSPELERIRAILADARALCREHGVDLVVAFVPAKFRVYRDLCRFAPDSPCTAWPSDDLPDDVGRVVAGLGPDVGFVDLTPPFRAAAEAGGLVYLPDDTHWSEEGHRLAAEALAPVLESRLDRPREGRVASAPPRR
ncbi:alginate O-acetyltransferase AlgX-related protein [Paludisphaera mucosa]|uniref:AlgX/AlgJ SGNH hydrolase-like domain-containing protein n=1 Tax=Paludisphaera mucosa TaxID=3030827 RepID=A0ABT6F8V9_9BACT|nr:hypothetical protein [Paludisphaera mucosa]MDG3004011.1 hypothetical protein [Paludisphaera mucosa]